MSPCGQDDDRHPAPIGTFSLSYNGDILIKFRQFVATELNYKKLGLKVSKSGQLSLL